MARFCQYSSEKKAKDETRMKLEFNCQPSSYQTTCCASWATVTDIMVHLNAPWYILPQYYDTIVFGLCWYMFLLNPNLKKKQQLKTQIFPGNKNILEKIRRFQRRSRAADWRILEESGICGPVDLSSVPTFCLYLNEKHLHAFLCCGILLYAERRAKSMIKMSTCCELWASLRTDGSLTSQAIVWMEEIAYN